jgi:hypothetical protein
MHVFLRSVRYIPKDSILHNHHRENLKTQMEEQSVE